MTSSINALSTKLQKSQIKSSKMKAYRALLLNQSLRPEYKVYKKHKNLQSFLNFLESTYSRITNAQQARILLYNESRSSLYYYPNISSTKIVEFS